VLIGARSGHLLVGILVGVLAVTGPRAAAGGEGSHSDSKSDNSSDSKGSADSSKSSGDSSKNSNGSSDRSGHATENSPRESSRGSSDESTNSNGGHAISIALVVLVVGGLVLGGVLTTRATGQDRQRTQALAKFLQRNHALVVRDVALGEGPLLASWERSLGLAPGERERLGRALAGSPEQTELLQALDGRIDEGRARRFAASFTRVARRSLGPSRLQQLTLAAGL
jgi:hypothetical protein